MAKRAYKSKKPSLGAETQFQIAYIKWLRMQYPNVFHHHSHNEGYKKGKLYGAIAKAMGQQRGFPDLIILEPRKEHPGLALEFKATYRNGTKGVVSTHQREILRKLAARNWKTAIVYDLDEAISITKEYLNAKP